MLGLRSSRAAAAFEPGSQTRLAKPTPVVTVASLYATETTGRSFVSTACGAARTPGVTPTTRLTGSALTTTAPNGGDAGDSG